MTKKDIKEFKNKAEIFPSKHERDLNKWCDVIEMICLFGKDKLQTNEDIEKLIEDDNLGIPPKELLEKSLYPQMGLIWTNTEVFSQDGEIDSGNDDGENADILEQFVSLLFSHLENRKKSFQDYYPFIVSTKEGKTKIEFTKKSILTKKNKLYLYLLISSNRNGLTQVLQRKLEMDFEHLAYLSFQYMLPLSAKHHLLGKGKFADTTFPKKKFEKFRELSEKFKVPLQSYIKEDYFKPSDTGEGGFDFIGWLDFDDNIATKIIYAGQATCMENWSKKYEDCSLKSLGSFWMRDRIGGYINALFIPYHFRIGYDWAYPDKIYSKEFVIFDRHRILSTLKINQVKNSIIPEKLIKSIIAR